MIEWTALLLTLKLALVVCAILVVIGMPIAAWLSFTHWRWKFLIESVDASTRSASDGTGLYVLVALGSNSPVGRWYHHLTGHGLAFTFEGLAIASVLYSLPFTVQPMVAAFSQVDRNLINASSILGASQLRTFFAIVLPLSVAGVVTGVVLSFAHTLGEFGVVLMVGGNIPGVTQTISIAITTRCRPSTTLPANHMALLLMTVSFITLSIIYAVNRRVWAVWPMHR